MSSVAVEKFGVVEKTSERDDESLQQIFNRIALLKYRFRGSLPSVSVPPIYNDFFANIFSQPSKMQGEPWIMIANSRQTLYFADSLTRSKM